jgi:hypothetical protein
VYDVRFISQSSTNFEPLTVTYRRSFISFSLRMTNTHLGQSHLPTPNRNSRFNATPAGPSGQPSPARSTTSPDISSLASSFPLGSSSYRSGIDFEYLSTHLSQCFSYSYLIFLTLINVFPIPVPFWKARFGVECVSAVVQGTLTSRAPKYSIILDLDRKVRDMELPSYAQGLPPQGLGLALTMSHFMLTNYHELSESLSLFHSSHIHRFFWLFFTYIAASSPTPFQATHPVQSRASTLPLSLLDIEAPAPLLGG